MYLTFSLSTTHGWLTRATQCHTLPDVMGRIYNMSDYLDTSIDRFCELAGKVKDKIRPVPTPFLDESRDPFEIIGEQGEGEPEEKRAALRGPRCANCGASQFYTPKAKKKGYQRVHARLQVAQRH